MDSRWIFTHDYEVRLYETDKLKRLTLPALCNYLEEIANHHAAKLSYSVDSLLEENKTWVLLRLATETNSTPLAGDNITIATWPCGINRVFFRRDFKIFREGSAAVCATTEWALMDTASRKLSSISREMAENLTPQEPEHSMQSPDWRLPEIKATDEQTHIIVRKSDIDKNGHVNNVKYVDFINEMLPADKQIEKTIVLYRSEAFLGDELLVKGTLDGNVSSQWIYNSKGTELIRAKIILNGD
jgi:acyl-ACP thioesterase